MFLTGESAKFMTSYFTQILTGRFSGLHFPDYRLGFGYFIISCSMGESNENFMGMLRETAIDAIRKSWDVVLDKKFEILKEKKYYGKIESTIIRSKV